MNVISVYVSSSFSSRMWFGVQKFRSLFKFGFQGSLRVASVFISIRVYVENLYMKSSVKNLIVIMLRYFYKGSKDKTLVRKATIVTSQTQTHKLHSTLYYCFSCIKVRDTEVCDVKLNEFKK